MYRKFFSNSIMAVLLIVPIIVKAQTWIDAASLPGPKQEIYSDVREGKIYTLGGLSNQALTVSDDFLEYDAFKNKWESLTPLPEARHHITVSIVGEYLYGIGGFTGGFPNWQANDSVFIYDFSNTEWNKVESLPQPRAEHVSAVIDDKIYIIGGRYRRTSDSVGYNEHIDTSSMVIFDTANGVWSNGSDAPTARNSHAAAVIDGKIYVVGGRQFTKQENGEYVNVNVKNLEVYDPVTERWKDLAPMPQGQGGLSAVALDGKLYVFGGEQWVPDQIVYASAWVYDPSKEQWSSIADMNTPRHGTAAAAIDDSIYVFGGAIETGAAAVATNEVFKPKKGG